MKRFIFVLLVIVIGISNYNVVMANTPRSASINYKQAVKIGRKSLNKKSVRMIIREILDRKHIERMEREFDDLQNTIPIPLYDSIHPYKFKNLA
tara:strand:- start:1097 stop:1378 length:282 start_codon:yes stop_codon:yes gene_type:complete